MVKDENDSDLFYVVGEVFTFGNKLHIYTMDGREAAFIRQELWTWMPKYQVYCNDSYVAEIRRDFTFFLPKYSVPELNWEIHGEFMAHEYQITQNGRQIATIRKAWMTWGDSYELTVFESGNQLMALVVLLVIDCVMAAQAASSSSSNH